MRRVLPWIILAALAVGGFLVTQHYLRSPYWALYQIGKAVHNHDSRLFLAYVDLGQIIASQKDAIVEMIFPSQEKHQQRDVVRQILSAFMAPITEQVRDRVVRAIEDQQRDNLPSSWTLVALGSVTVEGDQAQVVLSDPVHDRRLRLGMQRSAEGYWRVVEANAQDLRALAEKYLLTQGAPAAPSPANGSPKPMPAN
ncbi:MAG: DUF2939 domain-containing protein [Desulfarculus sp.]|nr:DUF2939 domain-containing protein [Desulfarculus sp.]